MTRFDDNIWPLTDAERDHFVAPYHVALRQCAVKWSTDGRGWLCIRAQHYPIPESCDWPTYIDTLIRDMVPGLDSGNWASCALWTLIEHVIIDE